MLSQAVLHARLPPRGYPPPPVRLLYYALGPLSVCFLVLWLPMLGQPPEEGPPYPTVLLHLIPDHLSVRTPIFPCSYLPPRTASTHAGSDPRTRLPLQVPPTSWSLSSQTRSPSHVYTFLTTVGFQQPRSKPPPPCECLPYLT